MTERRTPTGFERRREDERLITGRGQYVDDLRPPAGRPAPLIMSVVRSPYAHARIGAIQTGQASAIPGVVAVHSGRDLAGELAILASARAESGAQIEWRPMAIDTALYAGHPIAIVLAENGYAAADARALVEVEYEPLAAVTDAEQALAPGAPVLYEQLGSNELQRILVSGGDIEAAFARADGVIKLRLVNQRLAASPMEPRACMFDFDPATGRLMAWVSSQGVFRVRRALAQALHMPANSIQVINADTGGGFGTKIGLLGEEIVAALLAVRYGRPVKWIEDRSENIQANVHGRGQINDIEAAYTGNGRLLGLRVRTFADLGAFPGHAILDTPEIFQARSVRWLNGPYRIEAISGEILGTLTNAVPVSAYRGAGRPEATYMAERVMDAIARELNLDPVEVRRRNLLTPDMFPYTTPTGSVYDSGDYQAALDKALELADYSSWRERQREQRARGERNLLGIGVTTFTETSGGPFGPPDGPQDAATVRIMPDGTILVQSGVATNGQGHFTSFAQIAASVFAVAGARVTVQMDDSSLPGYSIGTFGSRVTQIAGSAILLAAEAAREKAVKLAADRLEVAPGDLVVADGRIAVRGVPSRSIELGELARAVEEQPQLIEREAPNPANGALIEGLAAWRSFTPEDPTVGSGAHIAIVELDSETGETRILRYIAVDDCGHVLNHHLVEAQIHGSLAQGIGQALYEEVAYDQDGQIVSGSLLDYALPKASQLPHYELGNVETPAPGNPLGAKGVGEAGCIAAPPAIVNAVLDALAPLGVTSIDMPLRPEKVWALMRRAAR
jgi:aerobic carbon-monoxide dehydrogenase large subunit